MLFSTNSNDEMVAAVEDFISEMPSDVSCDDIRKKRRHHQGHELKRTFMP